jgi:uncharacterized membrane protein YGL010W
MNTRLEKYFSDYHEFHRTRGNKVCHFVGIPMIMVSAFGLLALIRIVPGPVSMPLLQVDGGVVLWLAGAFWYLRLDWRLGLPFSCLALASYFLGRAILVPGLIVLFALGWIFQGVGHAVYEKRSPAFFKNVTHLLIGPLWIFASVARSEK